MKVYESKQSPVMPMETTERTNPHGAQEEAAGRVKGVDVSGAVVLRSWRADDADVAHTVTDTD